MHDRRPWILCAVVLLGYLLLRAAPAQADPTSPDDGCLKDLVCRGHYEQAMRLFDDGRFESALPEFQAAYQRRQMPWLLLNIGRTVHRLGRPRQAIEYYERFRQTENKPDAEALERVDQYTAQARSALEATSQDPTVPLPGSEGPIKDEPPPASEQKSVTKPPPPLVAPEPVKTEAKPVYKKWWFWTLIGGGVAAGVTAGVLAATLTQSSPGLPSGVPTIMFKL